VHLSFNVLFHASAYLLFGMKPWDLSLSLSLSLSLFSKSNNPTIQHQPNKVDMWALGVIMFTMVGGYPPFFAATNKELFPKILHAKFDYDDDSWGEIHQDCKDMIKGLLSINPQERWSCQQVLECQWMKDDAAELRRVSLLTNQSKLQQFNASLNELHHNNSHSEFEFSIASLDVSHQEMLEFHAIVGHNRRASLVGLPALEDSDGEEEEEEG
jgi:serine/threonine protein kinase